MILTRLTLSNFGSYAGTATIEFATDVTRNTTIIQGNNGAGKTCMYHALLFALYGPSAVPLDKVAPKPLINTGALEAGREHTPARASVMLEYNDSGKSYKLTRQARGYYINDGRDGNVRRIQYLSGEVSLTYTNPDGNTERDEYPDLSIEKMLPSPIRTFFLFDGDRIDEFTRPGKERDATISKAVNDVLHIEALSRAVERTAKISSEKRRLIDTTGAPAIEKTKSDITFAEMAVTRQSQRVSESETALKTCEERISVVEAELNSILEVARLAQARKKLDADRATLVERGAQQKKQLSRAIVSALPAFAAQKLTAASLVLDKYKSRHEIPARIAEFFIADLLQRGDCICGRLLGEDSAARARLKDLQESLYPDSLQDLATQLAGRLRLLREDGEKRLAAVVRLLNEIAINGTEIDRVDREIERIGAAIDESAISRAQSLNRERAELTKRLGQCRDERAKASRELDAAVTFKSRLNDKLQSEVLKQTGFSELSRVWTIAKECHEALLEAKKILEERIRKLLATEATSIVKMLASEQKRYFFSEIRVDSGFILRVIDDGGRDVRPQLSMGEGQVSSWAFMLAMTRIGGQEAPLVVDTPMARLDDSVREHIASGLPSLTPQLVLFVTDAEYTSEFEAQISGRVGAKVLLQPSATGTKIVREAHV